MKRNAIQKTLSSQFQEVIESVEALPLDEQVVLIKLIGQRLIQQWGTNLAIQVIKLVLPLWEKIKYLNWQTYLLFGSVAATLYFLFIPFLKTQAILSSEAYTLANVPIEFALYGKFHYPVHSQSFHYPGIDVFIMTAPLYYYISGWLLKIVGIGVWQVLLPGFLIILSTIILVIITAKKVYGYPTAIVVTLICATFFYLTHVWGEARPDVLLGFFFGVFLVVLYFAWFRPIPSYLSQLFSFLLGVLAVAMMASHWQGIYGFLYFPLHLLIMYRRGQSWFRHGILLTIGSVITFVLWALFYAYYGGDFLQILYAVYLGGLNRITYIRGAVMTIVWPITRPYFRGGWAVGVGVLLCLAYYGLWSIQPIRRKLLQPEMQDNRNTRNLDLLLLFSLIGWFVYYYFLIANKHHQYLANLLLPLLLLSARGYVLFLNVIKRLTIKSKILYGFLLLVFTAIAVSYLGQNLNLKNPFPIESPNKTYLATRRNLEKFVDKRYPLFLSVEIYHYLYDYNYTTNMAVEAEAFHKRYPDVGMMYEAPQDLTLIEKQTLAKDAGQIMIVTDTGNMHQQKYFGERIWSPNFKKVASVFSPHRGRAYNILYRNDMAETLFRKKQLQENSSGCNEGVLWIVYNPWYDTFSGITDQEWGTFSTSEKEEAILNYANQHQWFGRPKIEAQEKMSAVVDLVDKYFELQTERQESYTDYYKYDYDHHRSFEQAMDYVILTYFRAEWCKQNG
ncbi:ArnT family glycosyltransferase [Chloroflexota bacterium]